nr:Nif3-like dinuclear metal center hexameric protein [uncultured Peptoniphilus sp.]
MNTAELVDKLRAWAPEELQEPWDKTGWQLRLEEREIHNVVVAMDVTGDVVDLAVQKGAELIITHHPFLFSPLEVVEEKTLRGKMVCDLIRHNISVYSSHTSMDKAKGGVNDQWIKKLGLQSVRTLSDEDELGIMGSVSLTLADLKTIFERESITGVRWYGQRKERVETVAFVGGSGADYIEEAALKGADVLITGDVKHHDGQHAYEIGLMVIDIGHFHSEKAILETMAYWVEEVSDASAHVVMNSPFVFDI